MADLSLDFDVGDQGTAAAGDLVLSATGDLVLTDAAASIRQALILRLKAATGDYFMAPSDGIGWIEMLSDMAGYTDAFDAVLRNTVLNTPGVTGLLAWQVTNGPGKRSVAVAMEVATAQGTINFSLPVSADGVT